jgi:hypothetical protein
LREVASSSLVTDVVRFRKPLCMSCMAVKYWANRILNCFNRDFTQWLKDQMK